jgi:3-oxoacyl-[acyl-carrier-protein] synthase-3
MQTPKRVRIAGTGAAVPDGVITNQHLSQIVDTSDEWIVTRTGIRERRQAVDGQTTSDLATSAAQRALAAAGADPADVGTIIVATVTPDHMLPATACLVQARLGATHAGGFDLSSACTGFVSSLITGWSMVGMGATRSALVVGAETLSKITDYQDRATCILFGDGAGALYLEEARDGEPESELLATVMGADGSDRSMLYLPAGGSHLPASHETVSRRDHYMKMRGRDLFRFAVSIMRDIIPRTLDQAGVALEDVKLIVPHQVNKRMLDSVKEKMGIPDEQMIVNIDRYGNSSAASVPIALQEALDQGRIARGDLVLLMAFGAGLTWASALIRW